MLKGCPRGMVGGIYTGKQTNPVLVFFDLGIFLSPSRNIGEKVKGGFNRDTEEV